MLVIFVAAAKIWAVKIGTLFNPASLPCWPTCLVSSPALLARLPCCPTALLAGLPCWPACLVGPPALLAYFPCWPACLVGLIALLPSLPCWLACIRLPCLTVQCLISNLNNNAKLRNALLLLYYEAFYH
jgi:hypothetical protein